MQDETLFGLKIVDFDPGPSLPPDDREWVAEGSDWWIWRSGDVLMMEFQSGEHGGGLRSIAIEAHDLADLQSGRADCDEILRRHHAS